MIHHHMKLSLNEKEPHQMVALDITNLKSVNIPLPIKNSSCKFGQIQTDSYIKYKIWTPYQHKKTCNVWDLNIQPLYTQYQLEYCSKSNFALGRPTATPIQIILKNWITLVNSESIVKLKRMSIFSCGGLRFNSIASLCITASSHHIASYPRYMYEKLCLRPDKRKIIFISF